MDTVSFYFQQNKRRRERGINSASGGLVERDCVSVCLFATGLKKTRDEDKKCHVKTMKNKKR